MSEDSRGRIQDPRIVTRSARKPSPSLDARIKMFEPDAERRSCSLNGATAPKLSKELPPTPPIGDSDDELEEEDEEEFHPTKGNDSRNEHDDTDDSDEENAPQFASALQSPNNHDGTFNHASINSTSSPYSASSTDLQRRASVFSLSRVSFSAQLSRLTSLSLPLSEDISSKIRQLPTAREACNALISAGDQISRWIDTAKKVLRGLDAEDDVEWAAQGRESLNEVDAAIGKFSGLVTVYVELIDELQNREDTENVEPVLVEILKSMEGVLDGWSEVKVILKGVKGQVETAMEWTELWTMILQDIQAELDACQTIVFEEEEKRHRSMMEDAGAVDLDALETIIEETPISALPKVMKSGDESSLLGLMARMQPLRVSLDFLPMRLQSFQARAEKIFPSACEDLACRRSTLEKKWKKLDSDVEGLKKELGEDKWVALFRNAGGQVASMMGSVERSLRKLRDAVTLWEESGGKVDSDLASKIQSYEAKKVHYGAAIERALGLISKGVRDRITVNGEIIRLETAMRARWKYLEDGMADMEQDMNFLGLNAQTLRDSISSVTSLDVRSHAGSGINTPGSSPASSVVMPTSPGDVERKKSPASTTRAPSSAGSNRPSPHNRASSIPKKSPYARLSSTGSVAESSVRNSLSPTGSTGMARVSSTPGSYQLPLQGRRTLSTSSSVIKPLDNRPRWNSSTKTNESSSGHTFKPFNLATPSPYRKLPANPRTSGPKIATPTSPGSSGTRIPGPSPLSHGGSSLPGSPLLPSSRRSSSGLLKSPSPSPRLAPAAGNGRHPELRRQASMSRLRDQSWELRELPRDHFRTLSQNQTRRQSQDSITSSTISHTTYVEETGREREERQDQRDKENAKKDRSRPASAANARSNRISMLPRPTTPIGIGSGVKRNSMPPSNAYANAEQKAAENRPRWRG